MSTNKKSSPESIEREIKRMTRRKYSAEGGASVTSCMLEPFVWFPMYERGTEFKLKRYAQELGETDMVKKVMCAENRGAITFAAMARLKVILSTKCAFENGMCVVFDYEELGFLLMDKEMFFGWMPWSSEN